MKDILQTNKQAYAMHVLQRFDDFQQKGQYCDFEVKVDSEEILAHKNVLAAGSDYFNAMLSHDTLESQSGVVEIKEADAESVRKCIDFMYNRDVPITTEKCADLMHVAHMFQLHDFFNVIVTYVSDRLNAKSFFEGKRLAGIYELDTLDGECNSFALNNLAEISKVDKFMEIDEKYLSFLVEESSAAEDLKCFVTLNWIKSDPANRKGLLLHFIKNVKLPETDLAYRRYLIDSEPLVQEDRECLHVIMTSVFESVGVEAKNYSIDPTSLIVFDQSSSSLQESKFNNEWKKVTDMTPEMKKSQFSAIVLRNWIYVLMKNKEVRRLHYKAAGVSWDPVESMLEDHGDFPPVAVMGDCIYVAGAGYTKGNICNNFAEKYNVFSGKWFRIPKKNMSCCNSSLVALNRHLYSIGGCHQDDVLQEVECFDEEASTWKDVISMKNAREFPATCVFRERLYVLGGYQRGVIPSSVVECFNVVENLWTEIAPMKVPRGRFKVFATDQNIYAVGGRDDPAKSIDMFDFEKNKWEAIADIAHMDIERSASVAL